ncbi:DUF1345 domain-containing protein [Flexivirga sp. ID2601S]|uniref:DUF1345 domain-containing protein n=1 Tax=Flexivirga aerilata TaxID=1656889 RepID=A0A849ABM5_9MICO|nr:DUF1345 domain-containing protein [Flexivirga aerilata]NNG38304.1 DUF1345 domain-containing protein [Flexivirga aerilata]
MRDPRDVWWRSTRRLAEIVLVLLGIAFAVAPDDMLNLIILVAWDVLALAIIVTRWLAVRRAARGHETGWIHQVSGHRVAFLSALLASLTGMAGGLLIAKPELIFDGGVNPDLVTAIRIIAVPAVFAGWALLQFAYADRYARLYYEGQQQPHTLAFPETDDPDESDFAYFAFTLGTSFATSDVNVQDRRTRYVVLTHSVLAFFYNSIILSIAISVLR